jgi:hypothetical protein
VYSSAIEPFQTWLADDAQPTWAANANLEKQHIEGFIALPGPRRLPTGGSRPARTT